jgi:hypothetical protein
MNNLSIISLIIGMFLLYACIIAGIYRSIKRGKPIKSKLKLIENSKDDEETISLLHQTLEDLQKFYTISRFEKYTLRL